MTENVNIDNSYPIHDKVYRIIHDKILYGLLKPGETLTLRSLASEFDTSVMPVRDSVRRLSSEGALKLSASGRITTPVLNIERFNELIDVRKILEAELARKAFPRVHGALIERLESITQNMEAFAREREVSACLRSNIDFHRTLYLRAQSPIMLKMLETVWLQLSPTVGYGLSKNWHSLDKLEHNNILNALKKSDPLDLILLIKKDISSCHNLFTNI